MFISKIVSEYDQEIPQSQTADKPMAPRGRATQPSRDTRKTNQAKQPVLFPIKMIAKLEGTQSNVQQNIEQLQTPSHNGSNNKQKVNNNRTTALERTAAY